MNEVHRYSRGVVFKVLCFGWDLPRDHKLSREENHAFPHPRIPREPGGGRIPFSRSRALASLRQAEELFALQEAVDMSTDLFLALFLPVLMNCLAKTANSYAQ